MGHGQGALLERESELAKIDESISAVLAGDGRLLIVEGPAGIGKTSLLQEAGQRAAGRGMLVATAQGATLERDFGFGVVRQLFEAKLSALSERERRQLLTGAADLAAPVVAPGDVDPLAAGTQESAVVHGLYWLTANLAERSPLLIAIDDLHWSDAPSLLYVAYLARRLEGLPMLVVGAVRTGDPEVDAPIVNELVATNGVETMRPAALSVEGVRRLVTERLGEPDDDFAAACHDVTKGVPLLVEELGRVLADDAVEPTAAARDEVLAIGPRTVAHATVLRMARCSPSAVATAEAIAVLERQARPDRVAALAGLDAAEVREAQDVLTAMGILESGPPVRYAHPLVQRAMYDGIAPAQRADAHGRAASLLDAEGASLAETAAHLQLSAPSGRPEVVALLRAAAAEARERGAPASAVAYLRRAVEEGAAATSSERAELLRELGSSEALVSDPRAIEHLEAAFSLSDDPVARASMAYELAHLYVLIGDWLACEERFETAVVELGDRDIDRAARFEAGRAGGESFHRRTAGRFDERLPRLRELLQADVPGARNLALRVAAVLATRRGEQEEVTALVDRGLDGGRFLAEEGSESQDIIQGIWALVSIDDLERAEAGVAGICDDAQRRGSTFGYAVGCFLRAYVNGRRGRLREAEPDCQAAFKLATELGLVFAFPSFLYCCIELLEERPELAQAAGLAETIVLPPEMAESSSGGFLSVARARLRLQRGERADAVDLLRAAGDLFEAVHGRNPIAYLWRSPLALALPKSDRDEAVALVASELADATEMGLDRSIGVALRAQGLLEGGSAGLELLEESARVLERCPSDLERARTRIELGIALRRTDHRADARDVLRVGLDLAERCGAQRLAARAVEELKIAGARPRRVLLSGPESLTASEERVARMAADGLANREIAEALFVSVKTIENQLGAVYRKLGVSSRRALGAALTDPVDSA